MKQLRFVKYNPNQNMTIFVLDPVDRVDHQKVARQIMDYDHIHGEQVAFIEMAQTDQGKSLGLLRLQMMGGEFCGNASRALASYLVTINHPSIKLMQDHYQVIFEASGLDQPISAKVWLHPEGFHEVEVQMPLPLAVGRVSVDLGQDERAKSYRRVDFPGISHIIINHGGFSADNPKTDQAPLFRAIQTTLKDEPLDAFGLMFYDDKHQAMTPLVYVRATDSLIWERSCASGTAALGVSLSADRRGDLGMQVLQPGGALGVKVLRDQDRVKQILLKGPVKRVAEGWLYL